MPIDAPAVRELFDRLQFKTLLDRVFKIEGAAEDQALLEAPTAATTTAPAVTALSGEPLGHWLNAHRNQPIGVRITSLNGRPDAVGLSTVEESVEVASALDSVLTSWLSSDAPKVMHDSKRATRLLAEAGVELDGIAFDTLLGTWLLRPNQKVDSLGSLIYYYLGETLPEPDPNQLVPATDAVSPATEAWYVARLADDLQKRLDPGSLRVSSEIEVPLVPVLTRMERQGVTVSAPVLSELNARLGAEATLFRWAGQLERARPWFDRGRPNLVAPRGPRG